MPVLCCQLSGEKRPGFLHEISRNNMCCAFSATGETEEMFKKEIGNVRIFRERASLGWAKALREVLKEIEGGE